MVIWAMIWTILNLSFGHLLEHVIMLYVLYCLRLCGCRAVVRWSAVEAWQETGGSSLLGKDMELPCTVLSRVRHCHAYIQCLCLVCGLCCAVCAHLTPFNTPAQKRISGDKLACVQLRHVWMCHKNILWGTGIWLYSHTQRWSGNPCDHAATDT